MKSVKWELTQRCNLRCKHCFVGKIEYEKDIGIEEARRMIDLMVKSEVQELVLSTKEPFAYQYICELLDYCAEKDLYMTLVTNGTLITDRVLKSMSVNKIKSFSVSMEGISAVSNDYIRGEGVYEKVMTAIEKIEKMSQGTKYTIPLVLQMSLTSMNYLEVPNMIDWLEDSPFMTVNIGDISLLGNAEDNRNIKLTEEQYDQASEILLQKYSGLENPSFNLNLKKSSPYDTIYNNMRYGLNMECVVPSCASYHGYYSLLPNGGTCSCVALNDSYFSHIENLRSDHNLLMGDTFETESRIENLGHYKEKGFCKTCKFRDQCELCLLLVYDSDKFAESVAKCEKVAHRIEMVIDRILENQIHFGINQHGFIYEHDGKTELKKISQTGAESILDITECAEPIKKLYSSTSYLLCQEVFGGESEVTRNIVEKMVYNDLLVIKREDL